MRLPILLLATALLFTTPGLASAHSQLAKNGAAPVDFVDPPAHGFIHSADNVMSGLTSPSLSPEGGAVDESSSNATSDAGAEDGSGKAQPESSSAGYPELTLGVFGAAAAVVTGLTVWAVRRAYVKRVEGPTQPRKHKRDGLFKRSPMEGEGGLGLGHDTEAGAAGCSSPAEDAFERHEGPEITNSASVMQRVLQQMADPHTGPDEELGESLSQLQVHVDAHASLQAITTAVRNTPQTSHSRTGSAASALQQLIDDGHSMNSPRGGSGGKLSQKSSKSKKRTSSRRVGGRSQGRASADSHTELMATQGSRGASALSGFSGGSSADEGTPGGSRLGTGTCSPDTASPPTHSPPTLEHPVASSLPGPVVMTDRPTFRILPVTHTHTHTQGQA